MKRIYIKAGQVIGSDGYTDLKVNAKGGLELFSTEAADLDFYDEEDDTHHRLKYDLDMKVDGKKNPNFCKLYYEKGDDELKEIPETFGGVK